MDIEELNHIRDLAERADKLWAPAMSGEQNFPSPGFWPAMQALRHALDDFGDSPKSPPNEPPKIKGVVDQMVRDAGMTPPVDHSKTTLTDGSPVTEGHRELKANGQQKGYVVLSEEERPSRLRPAGALRLRPCGDCRPKHPLRDLTPEERATFHADEQGYVKYEVYPGRRLPRIGAGPPLDASRAGQDRQGMRHTDHDGAGDR